MRDKPTPLTPLPVGEGNPKTSRRFALPPHSKLQQRFHIFRWPAQHRTGAALDDWPLDQLRMLDHQRDDLIITEVFPAQAKFAINSFAGSQKLARLEAQLPD